MAYHHRAIELRYMGNTYEEVAQKLKEEFQKEFQNIRLRQWFRSGGILEALYLDYSKKENDRRRQLTLEKMKSVLDMIPEKYIALLNQRFETDLFGKKILDENGKPIPKLDSVTAKILKDICEMMGFKVEGNSDGSDPLDEYFTRAEQELAKKHVSTQGDSK